MHMYGITEESGLLKSFLSYASQLSAASILVFFGVVFFFLTSSPHPTLPTPQQSLGWGETGMVPVSAGSRVLFSLWGALIYTWRPQITDGCYILIY